MDQSRQSAATHTLVVGTTPLIISVPHAGTGLPPELAPQLTPLALTMPDTDWCVDRLYDFAPAMGATMIVARHSRYLIDLNRPSDDAALYSVAPQTGLCPTHSFAGEPLYLDGRAAVTAAEVSRRCLHYWQPYHDSLQALLHETRARHGYAVLLDAHSIRSVVPRLFADRLPDINVGTYDGRSCCGQINETLGRLLGSAPRWSHVFDGRFKGGHITRHYGQPSQGVHALQIELAQCSYMDESGATYDARRAAPLRQVLKSVVESLLALPLEPV